MKIIRFVLPFIMAIVTCHSIDAQVLRTNEKGEKIIVWPDGSWQYFADSTGKKYGGGNSEEGSNAQNFPIYDGTIDPLEGRVSITEDDLYRIAVRKSQLARDASEIASKRADEAILNRQRIEKELTAAKSNPNFDNSNVRFLKKRYEAALKTEKEALLEEIEAQELTRNADELISKGGYVEAFMDEQNQKKDYHLVQNNRYKNSSTLSYQDLLPLASQYWQQGEQTQTYPPQSICELMYEGKDDKTKQYRRDIDPDFLFTYTDERLRPYLKEKEYMRCDGYMTSLSGYRFLTLNFTFAYPNAREAYGFIEKGSVLTIKMLDGNFVNLFAGQMESGNYDTITKELTYNIVYPIDKSQMALLKNSEVDALRVFWSSGYEEYQVYQLDFFMNQIECLESRK